MTPLAEHVYRRQVQYRETDVSGIVHFSNFFVYAEEAEHALWRAAGLSIEPRETTLGWPRVSAAFDFYRPLRFEDALEVRIRLIARTAKTFQYQTVISVGGEIAAIGTSTSICVRKVAGRPLEAMDIPESIASRFDVVEPVPPPRRAHRDR